MKTGLLITHYSFLITSNLESAPVKKFILVLGVLLIACGKRGDPHAPVPVIPKATSDLVVTQRGTKVILTWSYPSLTTSGKTLHDLRRVTVYRATEEQQVPQTGRDLNAVLPGDVDTTQPQAIAQFAKVPQLTATQFTKLREKVDSLENANLPAATTGAHLVYEDTPAFRTRDGRPVRLTYAIVNEGLEAKSDASNLAMIVPLDVPLPPPKLAATPKPEGVVLTWDKPTASLTANAKPFLIGYNIYRITATETSDDLGTPINASPIAKQTYTDAPAYATYRYRVTAVAAAGPPRIESDPSQPATVTFKDLTPPPPPATLTALVEPKGVRLLWDAVDAPDLAGYYVYRYEGKIRITFQSAGPIPSTHFEDISPDPGIE